MADLEFANPQLNNALVEFIEADAGYKVALANNYEMVKTLRKSNNAERKVIEALGLGEFRRTDPFVRVQMMESSRDIEYNNGIGRIVEREDVIKLSLVPKDNGERNNVYFQIKRHGPNISFDAADIVSALKKFRDKCAIVANKNLEFKGQESDLPQKLGSTIDNLENNINAAQGVATSVAAITSVESGNTRLAEARKK